MKNGKLSPVIISMFEKCIVEYNRVHHINTSNSYNDYSKRLTAWYGKCHW